MVTYIATRKNQIRFNEDRKCIDRNNYYGILMCIEISEMLAKPTNLSIEAIADSANSSKR